ncbi:MAG: DNA topoisomerase I [Legionellales bacterium]|nr:DNA topoisomerase I [Legionellales bacterium]
MGKSLLIVESPSKAKTIKQYLNNQYEVVASYGHVRDLIPKEGAVNTQDFSMKYDTIARNSKHVDKIIDLAKKTDEILLATDPDREGEAIAWHIAHLIHANKKCKDKSCKRVIFHQITKKAIIDALSSPREIAMPLVNAQQARRALDYLVGFNLSPLLWKKIRRGLSAGRVQSPALKMIVERELEIRAFKSEEYWSITSKHQEQGIEFDAKLTHFDGQKLENLSIKNETMATSFLEQIKTASQGQLVVNELTEKERKRNPPPPYTTSTLQQDAVRKLGFSASKTMRVAQQLYEGVDIANEHVGLITYMRTDSVHIADEVLPLMREYIKKQYGEDFLPNSIRIFKTKTKNAQEAHEAIRPTDFSRRPEQLSKLLSPEQFKLYQMIWQRGLASQMAHAVMDTMSLDLAAGQIAIFRASGSSIKHPGYLKVYQEGTDDPKASIDEKNILPRLKKKDPVAIKDIDAAQHFTEPPPRFNEATLVKNLEEKGIGRPSTYASIISTLLDREYVEKDNKRFIPTDVGEIVNQFLTKHFTQYVEYDFTAKLEDDLDAISRGETEWKPLMESFWQPFHQQIETIGENVQRSDVTEEKMDEKCPKCEAHLVTKLGKRGRFVGCSQYPECDYTRNLDGEQEPETPELVGRQCPKCEADLVYKMGRYGKFIGCSRYPDCKHIESLKVSEDTGITCPKCNENHLMKKLTRRGKIFFGCKGYPKCQYALWHTPLQRTCPACQWPIMMEQVTKKEGTKITCPECKHVIAD